MAGARTAKTGQITGSVQQDTEPTSAMPMLAVETAVGWKGMSAQLAAFSSRSLAEAVGNSARTICVEDNAIVQSARPWQSLLCSALEQA